MTVFLTIGIALSLLLAGCGGATSAAVEDTSLPPTPLPSSTIAPTSTDAPPQPTTAVPSPTTTTQPSPTDTTQPTATLVVDTPTAIPTDIPTQAPTEAPTVSATKKPGTAFMTLQDFEFVPAKLTIPAGTTVVFLIKSAAGVCHGPYSSFPDNTDPSGLFDSGSLFDGQQFAFTFTQAGSITVRCGCHPFMIGTIDVTP